MPTNSAPVVTSFAGILPMHAAAEPGDDRREQGQEDDRLDHRLSPASG